MSVLETHFDASLVAHRFALNIIEFLYHSTVLIAAAATDEEVAAETCSLVSNSQTMTQIWLSHVDVVCR